MRALAVGLSLVLATACSGSSTVEDTEAPTPLQTSEAATETVATESPTASASETAGDEQVCDLLQAVKDADDQAKVELQDHLTKVGSATSAAARERAVRHFLDDYRTYIDEEGAATLATYEELAEVVPASLHDDVLAIRDFTEQVNERLESAQTLEDLQSALVGGGRAADARAAGKATLRLTEFSRDTCGIVLKP